MERNMEYNGNTSFLKLGNKIFNVELITENGMDIENKIVNYHKGVLSSAVKTLYDGQVEEDNDLWYDQIQKIQDLNRVANSNTNVTLDISSLQFRNKVFMSHGNKFLVVKRVFYSPKIVTGTKEYANSLFVNIIEEKIGSTLPEKFEVSMTSTMNIPIWVGYVYNNPAKIYTPLIQTYHTMGDKSLCTGSYKDKFWSEDTNELAKRINAINLDSLATRNVSGHDANGIEVSLIRLTGFLTEATDYRIVENGWGG